MNIWHRFTHWLMSDMLTLEERELIAQEARRLKLKTDLQEARLNKRADRLTHFNQIGVWKQPCRYGGEDAVFFVYLEERSDNRQRRLTPAPSLPKRPVQSSNNCALMTS